MTWVRLDENFPDHPKVSMAGPLAAWLHVCALGWCNRHLTDGFVPTAQVSRLADLSAVSEDGQPANAGVLAERLVTVGMWERVEGGYRLHDYLDYQPSRSEVEATREQRAAAGRRGGLAKAKQTPSKPLAKGQQTPGKGPSKTEAKVCPDPVPGTDSSSSSALNLKKGDASREDEELIARACRLEAERRLGLTPTEVVHPERWLAATAREIEGHRRSDLQRWVSAGHDPPAMARLLANLAPAPHPPRWSPPDDQPPVYDLTALRQSLRQVRESIRGEENAP